MFALPDYLESGFFQRLDSLKVINAGNLGHELDCYFDFAHIRVLYQFINSRKVFSDCILNIFDCLLLGAALGPTSWEAGTGDAESFFGFFQANLVFHPGWILSAWPTIGKSHQLDRPERKQS
jgi:hypothetical protein